MNLEDLENLSHKIKFEGPLPEEDSLEHFMLFGYQIIRTEHPGKLLSEQEILDNIKKLKDQLDERNR